MTYEVTVGERRLAVAVRPSGPGRYRVSVDGGPEREVEASALGGAEWALALDGRREVLGLAVVGDRFDAQVKGHALRGTVEDPRARALQLEGGADAGEVRTQMPGAVVRVLVEVGAQVRKGQVLLVVEAMKMENEFKAPCEGVVSEIAVRVGEAVEAQALLAVVSP